MASHTSTNPHPHRPNTLRALLAAVLVSSTMAGCAVQPSPSAARTEPANATHDTSDAGPAATACPADLPPATRCLSGRDPAGAFYVIAVPPDWTGALVLHAHGGPALGAPKLARSMQDLERWAVVVKAGYAWAGSSFRQGGVAVRAAAEDTERLRRIFVAQVGQPRLTILHGQSWGASVAATGASMFTDDGHGQRPYDAVLLTSGVLAGGTRAYDMRLDLRVIYQQLCNNHPLPSEPAYSLWMGLPAGATLTRHALEGRVNACLGLNMAPALRSAEQQRRVHTLVAVLKIPETSIVSHLNWATWHFQDVVQHRTGGANPFGNIGAVYAGSSDDAALNRAVLRYRADPQAVRTFGADADPDGRIPVPVLTVHGIGDPTAFVEMDDTFRHTMEQAGTADHLVQTFTSDRGHSYLTEPTYPTLLAALSQWAQGGRAPTAAQIAAQCPAFEAAFGAGCHFVPDYVPAPLDSRVTVRERP